MLFIVFIDKSIISIFSFKLHQIERFEVRNSKKFLGGAHRALPQTLPLLFLWLRPPFGLRPPSNLWRFAPSNCASPISAPQLLTLDCALGEKSVQALPFSAFFLGKKDAYVFAVSVRPSVSQFSSEPKNIRTQIFSIAPSILMLETVQIWFISDNAFQSWDQHLKNRAPKG